MPTITEDTPSCTAAALKLPCSTTATNACMQRKVSIDNSRFPIWKAYAGYLTSAAGAD
ncbi:hypothetical protein D3C85_1766940 [compost metagenome]